MVFTRTRLLEGVKAFYKNTEACIRVGGEMNENLRIQGSVRQGYVMSPWED